MRYGDHSALALPPVSNGLGMANSSYGLAEDSFPVPASLDIVWMSWVDKMFYAAEVDFPVDKIAALFEEGHVNNEGEKEFYNKVNVGLLPEGKIVIYLSGYNKRIEICQFQGVEADVDIKDYLPYAYYAYKDYDAYFNDIFSEKEPWIVNYKRNDVPHKLWERYFERFDYDVKLVFENEESFCKSVKYRFANAEICITNRYAPDIPIRPSSRIHTIITGWTVGKSYYSAWFYFDEQEVLSAFDEVFKGNLIQKGELVVKVSKCNNLFDILLMIGERSFKFEKTQIRVFKESAEQKDNDAELIYKNYEGMHRLFLGE